MLPRSIIATGLWISLGTLGTMLQAAAQGYSQEQQQLCSGDALRLCGPEIPNVDRVTACMIRQRAQLSPGCQSVFRPAQVAAPVRAERPINMRPKTKRATVKPSKSATPRQAKTLAS